jgi:uncharacterized protein (TIGR02453 family)
MVKRPTPAPPSFTGFPRATLRYLGQLRRNNRRDWFEEHRGEYQTLVRDTMAAFVEEMDARLGRLLPELTGDPRRAVFRIHRDVRFSRDKSPYKTHAACWFRHQDSGREAVHGGAGLYLHVEGGASMVAAGIWMPAKPSLDAIREALMADHERFADIVTAPAFRRRFGALSREAMLTRMPRGVGSDHPAGEWLRYKSFTVRRMLDDREITDPRLPDLLEPDIAMLAPMIRWLNAAVGLPPAERRR